MGRVKARRSPSMLGRCKGSRRLTPLSSGLKRRAPHARWLDGNSRAPERSRGARSTQACRADCGAPSSGAALPPAGGACAARRADHITVAPGPARGRRDLERLASRFLSQQLDRRRPLWVIVVVPRAGPGKAAILGKVHHAMVDGIAAVARDTPTAPPASSDRCFATRVAELEHAVGRERRSTSKHGAPGRGAQVRHSASARN